MKRVLKLNNIKCAHCAEKMQNKISKLESVNDCSISFMTQRMTVDFCDGSNLSETIDSIRSIVKSIEPKCELLSII